MSILLNILSDYKYEISDWLIKQKNIEKVYLPNISSLYIEKEEAKLNDNIYFWPLQDMVTQGIENMNLQDVTEPLDGEFIDKASVFESMFIHCDSQLGSMPIGMYHECKRRYYLYLRYWKDFFIKNRIKYIVYDDVPHWPAIYASYIVGQIMNIRTIILAPVGIRVQDIDGYLFLYGYTLETIGASVKSYFRNEYIPDDIQLKGLVNAYFERSNNKKNEAVIRPDSRKKWLKYVRNAKYSTPDLVFPGCYAMVHNIIYLTRNILSGRPLSVYYSKKLDHKSVRDLKRFHLYRKYDSSSLQDYEKLAQMPNYNDKYILYPLQLWPEATTTPLAGWFAEQYNAIQLLAYIAKDYGIKIYVKEYYLQPYRNSLFWEELSGISNVVFIKSSFSSGELMEHALAVANQTGTCLLEAPFYGIPALAFGKGYCLKGMPGLFEIENVEQGRDVLKKILDGISIDTNELKKYYYAIQENSVFFHRDPLGKVKVGSDEYWKTISELKAFLSRELSITSN